MGERPTLRDALASVRAADFGELQQLLSAAPFGVYVDEPERGCIYANDALLEQFDTDWEHFQGFGWARHIVAEDAERMLARVAEYERTLEPIYVTYRVTGRSGARRVIHARVHAIVRDGTHVGSFGVTQDVTAAHEHLDAAKHRSRLEAVGRLAAGVAHDFNNLLGVILTCTGMLRDPDPDSDGDAEHAADDRARSLAMLEEAVQQGAAITRQLLLVSRQELPDTGICTLDEQLDDLSNLLARTLGEGISLELSLGAPNTNIPVQPMQLAQMVINLATNARDAMLGRGTLTVKTAKDGERVTLTVTDTGMGMDRTTLDRAFEPFFTTKDPGRGTGLGLATLRQELEFCGGTIEATSTPGQGSAFTLTFPVVDQQLPRAAVRSHVTQGPGRESAPGKILLLEDNDSLRQALGYALAMAGHEVRTARDLKSAREYIATARTKPEVVVSDVLLPDGEGTTLVEELRREDKDLPVVFISGFAGENLTSIRAAEKAGHTIFLEKPFRPTALCEAVAELLAASDLREAHKEE